MTASDSDGTVSPWSLDYNDGTAPSSGNGSPPSSLTHTYTTAGTFYPTLGVADDDDATAFSTKTIYVSAPTQPNQAPTCSVQPTPQSGPAPLAVTFSMSASDPDGSIASWQLDANGDGSADMSGNGAPPSTRTYTYSASGNYSVVLIVRDDDGASGVGSATVYVGATQTNQPPTCNLGATPTSGNAPLTVTFTMTASDSDGTVSPWSLNYNDGTPASSGSGSPPSSLTHTYTTAGTFYPTLGVADDDDATAFSTKTIYVNSPAPTLAFTLSPPTITTSSSTYRATLQLTGSNFLNVNQVSYSWTGAGSGSATWNKGDLSWNSAVVVGSDGSMTLSPVVLSNVTSSQSKTWTWTVTLRDNTGATASGSFTVTYNP
jgi:PKD repeat protein